MSGHPRSTVYSICALLLLGSNCVKGDDLFSQVATESVFASASSPEDNKGAGSPASRITGASALEKLLQSTDFETKQLNSNAVSTSVIAGTWKIPVRMAVAIDEDRVEIALLLSKIKDEASIPVGRLLELMSQNRNPNAGVFTYNAEQTRFELRKFVSNVNLTSQQLQRHLLQLASMAENSVDAWRRIASVDASTAAKQPQPTPSSVSAPSAASGATVPAKRPSSAPASINGLTGTWSATRANNQAMALQIAANGKFTLVVVSGSQNTRSEGTASITGTQLNLVGNDGTTISGSLSAVSASGFQLKIGNQSPIAFKKAG